jgi:hypothetical protein
MSHKAIDSNPFAEQVTVRPSISLWMLIFSLVVCAAFSMLLMFAARVPAITDTINDFFGIAKAAKSDKPDRSTHLFFLLFCYASPLLLAMWVGLLQLLLTRLATLRTSIDMGDEPDSPFA